MDTPLTTWILFNVFVGVCLIIDLFFHRKDRDISFKEAILWSSIWIALALLFYIFLHWQRGEKDAIAFLTGYLVEKALSLDNLFVFLAIFSYFNTPAVFQHRILFWGVLGAVLMRGLFIFLGVSILQNFHWVFFLLGAFLIYTGIRFIFFKTLIRQPQKNRVVTLFRKMLRVAEHYEGHNFFTRIQGRLFATPLLIVLLVVETSDVIFALDSIPAILGITLDPFLVYTSNIFAILGLRSLFFVLAHFLYLFAYLHYGLAAILIFIGVKMLISSFVSIPLYLTLIIIVVFLAISIVASLLFSTEDNKR